MGREGGGATAEQPHGEERPLHRIYEEISRKRATCTAECRIPTPAPSSSPMGNANHPPNICLQDVAFLDTGPKGPCECCRTPTMRLRVPFPPPPLLCLQWLLPCSSCCVASLPARERAAPMSRREAKLSQSPVLEPFHPERLSVGYLRMCLSLRDIETLFWYSTQHVSRLQPAQRRANLQAASRRVREEKSAITGSTHVSNAAKSRQMPHTLRQCSACLVLFATFPQHRIIADRRLRC